MEILYGAASLLLGGGMLAFMQFLITRHDNKHDKLKGVYEAIVGLSKQIKSVADKADECNAVNSRVRILRFADEMMEGKRHSKDSWDQVMSDITDYEKYCEAHPDFRNGQTAATVEYLKKNYIERLEKHDFL